MQRKESINNNSQFNKNIYDLTTMAIDELYDFISNLKLSNEEKVALDQAMEI